MTLLLSCLLIGCGYAVGSAYQAEVRTVHVPIFRSESFRRGFDYQLTEAVQKKIQQRTPFRLAKSSQADTRLTGRIVELRKEGLSETNFDDPRQLEVSLVVEASWQDLRSGRVLAQREIPVSPELVHLSSQASFAPEVGQSLATGTHQAIDRMATKIVDMMETPW